MPNLTTSGSPTFNGDSTCTIDSTGSDVVSAPSSLISNSQMWFAARIATTFANTTDPYAGGDMRIFQFGTTDPDNLNLIYAPATDTWRSRRQVTSTPGDAASGAQTFASGAKFTLVFAVDASNVKLSVNGAAFVSTAKAAGAISASTFEIGNRSAGDRAGNVTFFWAAAGTGTLSDADASTLNGFGDTDPTWRALPDTPTFLWTADSTAYLDAAPVEIESRNPAANSDTGGAATTGATSAASHAVVLPATVSAGALLMILGRVTTTGTVAITGGGWTIIQASDQSVGPDVQFWAYKNTLAAGTEDGTSVTVTHGTGKLAVHSLSIIGAADPAIQPPQFAVVDSVTENTTIDPPALTPSGGAKAYLWLVMAGAEGALAALDKTPPANYGNDIDVRTGVAANNWDNCSVHVATRALEAASEDPGTMTTSSADNWLAYTIAVHPPGGGGPPPMKVEYFQRVRLSVDKMRG